MHTKVYIQKVLIVLAFQSEEMRNLSFTMRKCQMHVVLLVCFEIFGVYGNIKFIIDHTFRAIKYAYKSIHSKGLTALAFQ